MKQSNEYARLLAGSYGRIPKAVLAAVAVAAVRGELDSVIQVEDCHSAEQRVLRAWEFLHAAGVVPQKPIPPIQPIRQPRRLR